MAETRRTRGDLHHQRRSYRAREDGSDASFRPQLSTSTDDGTYNLIRRPSSAGSSTLESAKAAADVPKSATEAAADISAAVAGVLGPSEYSAAVLSALSARIAAPPKPTFAIRMMSQQKKSRLDSWRARGHVTTAMTLSVPSWTPPVLSLGRASAIAST